MPQRRSAFALALSVAATLVVAIVAASDGAQLRGTAKAGAVRDGSDAVPLHKVVVDAGSPESERLARDGAVFVADYGSFAVYETSAYDPARAGAHIAVRDDMFLVRTRRGDFDTRTATVASEAPDRLDTSALYIVQFRAPVVDAWRHEAATAGLEVIAPVPNCALLVRAKDSAVRAFSKRPDVSWFGYYGPRERLDPSLDAAVVNDGRVEVAVEIVADADGLALSRELAHEADHLMQPVAMVGRFAVVRAALDTVRIRSLLDDARVVNIEPVRRAQLLDERVGVVTAGALDASGMRPSSPGYLQWLAGQGFSGGTFDFGIDFADSGLDTGVVGATSMHPSFRAPDGSSRVAYAMNYSAGASHDPGDFYGHGTLNASIATGYASADSGDLADGEGYLYGLGVAPFVRLGSSKIFDSGVSISLAATYSEIASHAYRSGMRISSNSWGAAANQYTIESQEYDTIVRDADPTSPGNQEYSVCFAAGNAYGGGTITTPATAKNVIAVGATEGFRPEGIVDGCGVGDEGADSVDDIIDFSSGGPLADGRIKPDLVAPGTHVIGAASQNRFYNGIGLCVDAARSKYFPYDQTLYAWSSGTSQATPVVAGASALVRAYIVMKGLLGGGVAPSPAMVKAQLVASATPVDGSFAGRTLPDARQGYGRVNLQPVFDDAARVLVDQTVVFGGAGETHTETGEVGDPERPFRVALVWTDAPGLPSLAPEVNDLDLEVRVGDTIYRGNAFDGFFSKADPATAPDSLNNVEVVTVPAGVRGPFTVTVTARSVSGDGVPGNADLTDQDFALVIYNVDDGRWSGPPAPVISNVVAKRRNGFKLLVYADRLSAATTVDINGAAVATSRITFLAAKSALKLKGPAAALGLVQGDNQIAVTEAGKRSAVYNFRYSR